MKKIRFLLFCLCLSTQAIASLTTLTINGTAPLASVKAQVSSSTLTALKTLVITNGAKATPVQLRNTLDLISPKQWQQIQTISIDVQTANTRYNTLRAFFMRASNLEILRITPAGKPAVALRIDPTYIVNGKDVFFKHFIGYDINVSLSNTGFTKFLSEFEINRQLSQSRFAIDNETQARLAANWKPRQTFKQFHFAINLKKVSPQSAINLFARLKNIRHAPHSATSIALINANNLSAHERALVESSAHSYIKTLKNNGLTASQISAFDWQRNNLERLTPVSSQSKKLDPDNAWREFSDVPSEKPSTENQTIRHPFQNAPSVPAQNLDEEGL